MNVYLDLVDWVWLTSFPTARERADALAYPTTPAGVLVSCIDLVEGWNDSYTCHRRIASALEVTTARADKPKADLLQVGLYPFLSGEDRFDELGLCRVSIDYSVYATLPPKTVAKAALAVSTLDLASLARELLPGDDGMVVEYLEQRTAVLSRGWSLGMGALAVLT